MSVIPIRDLGSRLPQAGRIRLGEKGGKQGRRSISRFRFTAPVSPPLERLAELYGGVVSTWREPKSTDRFELYSNANEIRVVLPPDPLYVAYELWGGSGLQRRCDGERCQISVPTDDGAEMVEKACLCVERGALECNLKLRLHVIIPEVRGLGMWRLDSSSEYAAREMPAIVKAITALDGGQSMVGALLRVEERSGTKMTKKGPQTRRYNVPVIDFAASLDEIAAGAAKVALNPGVSPSSGAVPPGTDLPSLPRGVGPTYLDPTAGDDEITDAEVVEDEVPIEEISEWLALLPQRQHNKILSQARALASELGEPIPASFEAITGRVLEVIWRGLNTEETPHG